MSYSGPTLVTPSLRKIPTNILTGFLGTGKTTAIRQLLGHVPSGQRWAVLVNEFGEIGIDGALLSESGAVIREVAGGCVCCTTSPLFRVALTRILREVRPDRLLIEPSGLAHPLRIIETLQGTDFQHWIDLKATLCLINPAHLRSEKHRQHPTFQDQALLAEVLLAAKADQCSDEDLQLFDAFASSFRPPKAGTGRVHHGDFQTSLLDLPSGHHSASSSRLHALGPATPANPEEPAPEKLIPRRRFQHSLDMASLGFVWPGEWQLSAHELEDLLYRYQALRAKGIIHSDQGWLEIQFSEGTLTTSEAAQRSDMRLEFICPPDFPWQELEQALSHLLSQNSTIQRQSDP